MQHGTDEQKQKYLPKMATGEVRGVVLDVRAGRSAPTCPAIRTKAVQDGDVAT